MAYAAAVSLAQILNQLLHSDPYHFDYPKPQIESLYAKVCFLQSRLEEIFPAPNSRMVEANDLEIQIRDLIYKAQDAVEFFISSQIRSLEPDAEITAEDQNSTSILVEELQEIMAKLDPISETADKFRGSITESKETIYEMSQKPHISSKSTVTVGQDNDLLHLLDVLTGQERQLRVVPIVGMGGIGKTTLARNTYENQVIVDYFDIRGWVTVSKDYDIQEILRELLRCFAGSTKMMRTSGAELGDMVHKILFGRRYLIVMDDVWDELVWSRVRLIFPDNNNGSRVVVTTRVTDVAVKFSSVNHQLQLLDEEQSWMSLRQTVFGGEDCPRELENIGRYIAQKCGGLPLAITVIGGLLSKSRTVEYWKSIGEDAQGAIGDEEYNKKFILSLSYNNLPSKLKACFLYVGAFPKDSEILVSKLIKLWVAEGFLEPPSSPSESLEQVANQHLKDLIDRNLISVCKSGYDGQPKTCSMQGNLQELALKECQQENFFHAVSRYVVELPESAESQRRICVHKNILMCAKDVYFRTKSIKLARTLLYTGLDHHHPLPFCLTFDLLRVLDALSVYFIELPNALFELIHLRYLAFTYDEDLPPSISKLRNLLILIVRQHPKIIIRRPLILPMEIWNMSQIRHLLFSESVLPDPFGSQNSTLLENLQCLSNINAACCTKEMLQNMPNLKKLGIWIESPGALHLYLDQLPLLESLKFTILKPILEEKIDFLPQLVFPKTLKKLSLSGCGIPWEDMTIIGQLPWLEVLKLRELAFQGPEWSPIEGEFCQLKFLLLESLDLVHWTADGSYFPMLKCLIISHCYELEEISSYIAEIPSLELIKLVHCSPPAVLWACKIQEEREDLGYDEIQIDIHSSREWEQRIREGLKDLNYVGIKFSWE